MLTFAVSIVLILQSIGDAKLPAELQRTLAMRRSMRTGHLRYRLAISGMRGGYVGNCECRTTGESYFVTDYGDDDGVMGIKPDLTPNLGIRFASSPRNEIMDRDRGENCTYVQYSTSVGLHAGESPNLYDIRMIGLECYPLLHYAEFLGEIWLTFFPEMKNWNVEHANGLILVEASRLFEKEENFPKLRQTWQWTIDPAKDYALLELDIRIQEEGQPQKQWGNAQTQYEFIDNYWFPSKCSAWRLGDKQGVWRTEYKLVKANFDRPEHPKKMSIELLPVPAGAWVVKSQTGERLVWNGSKAVPREKWLEFRAATGNRELEKLMTKNRERDDYRYPAWWYDESSKMGIPDLETNPDAWEAYVRRWCLKNGVDDKQRTEAKAVLESSRKEAFTILDKRAPELDKIEALLKDKTLDPKKADDARAEANRLLAPIGEIFTRLKARLDALLLQKQIAAKQATSAPAAMP